ncbi:MAG: hypothetical protein RI885_1154 [Actinomycetota bacterium]
MDWHDARAVELRAVMDDEMTERYRGRHDGDPDFPRKADVAFAVDAADVARTVLLVDENDIAVAHAALRMLRGRLEVKRVIVADGYRGAGLGRRIMAAAEGVARELGYDSIILQTGDRQPEAVALYQSIGYRPIPIYEPYVAITNSLCFEKRLA